MRWSGLLFVSVQFLAWSIVKPSAYLFQRYEHQRDKLSEARIGSFKISWDQFDPYLLITNVQEPEKVLFQTLPSWAFITIGFAMDSSQPVVDGNYRINEWTLYETPNQNIKKVTLLENEFIISGDIWGVVTMATYSLRFFIPTDDVSQKRLENQLAFNLTVDLQQGTFNRLFLNYWCDLEEKFYGFGVQYSHWNLKGRRIPIVVAEQGIGRGAEPITSFLNFFADRAGGDWSTTYAPKPVYITNFNRSILLENSEITFFDLREDHSVVIEAWSNSIRGRILFGRSMLDLVTQISAYTGRMKPLPAWTQSGAIIGMQGGTDAVLLNIKKLIANQSRDEVPSLLAGLWLQDWVGQRHSYDGDRLQWNWVLNQQHYPQWYEKIVQPLASSPQRTRILTYINPFFSPLPTYETNSTAANTSNSKRRDLFKEGIEWGYFVRDSSGSPYKLSSGSIDFHMVDFTNPAARRWMKEIIKQELIQGAKSSGWMADFGEYLPFDAVLHDGSSASTNHNLYPLQWAQLNEEACQEARQEGIIEGVINSLYQTPQEESTDCEMLYFLRSGWMQSPKHARAFWLGDQLVTWDEHDGLKSSIVAALSGGLTGHSLTHTDIGGYTMHDSGPYPYRRSEELLLRWIEVSTFGNAVFRTHTGLSTSDYNAQVYSSPRITLHFNLFTHVFVALKEYRHQLMHEAQTLGWPLMRPMAAHFAHDNLSWDLTEQFMFGSDFLVAPVLSAAAASIEIVSPHARNHPLFDDIQVTSVKVYLPAHSQWVHLWSGQKIAVNDDEGRYVSVDAPIGAPPVFYLRHSKHGAKLREYIRKLGMNVHCEDVESVSHSPEEWEDDEFGKWAGEMGTISFHRPRDWFDILGVKSFLGS